MKISNKTYNVCSHFIHLFESFDYKIGSIILRRNEDRETNFYEISLSFSGKDNSNKQFQTSVSMIDEEMHTILCKRSRDFLICDDVKSLRFHFNNVPSLSDIEKYLLTQLFNYYHITEGTIMKKSNHLIIKTKNPFEGIETDIEINLSLKPLKDNNFKELEEEYEYFIEDLDLGEDTRKAALLNQTLSACDCIYQNGRVLYKGNFKISFSEFLDKDNVFIHCKTRDNFDFLMDKLMEATPGNIFYNVNKGIEGVWYDYGEDSCVKNDGTGMKYEYCKASKNNYAIYEFDELDFSK